jgi:alpha-tubulin suppressor-like RCC1 family protein
VLKGAYTGTSYLGDASTNKIVAIAAGGDESSMSSHCLAVAANGRVFAWGSNSYGQLGSSRTDSAPRPVPGVDRVVRVLRGMVSTCALRDDGSLWCWGDGYLASDRRSQRNTVPHPIDW